MKVYLVIWLIFFTFKSFLQLQDQTQANKYEFNLDTISCEHLILAHNIVLKEGVQKFSEVVDYPILNYIAKTKRCKGLVSHRIGEDDLKYFIFVILTFGKVE